MGRGSYRDTVEITVVAVESKKQNDRRTATEGEGSGKKKEEMEWGKETVAKTEMKG